MTMPELAGALAGALADATGVQVHPDAIGRFLRKRGFTYKNVDRHRTTPRTGKETRRRLVRSSLASSLGITGSSCFH